nr:MAG TPA: hypothetical protein [Caudoviricetes sp.]
METTDFSNLFYIGTSSTISKNEKVQLPRFFR